MPVPDRELTPLCVIRGGGDLATGVAWRLWRAGYRVVITELAKPLTVRRAVSLSTAVSEGSVDVEGMVGRLSPTVLATGEVTVMVSPGIPPIQPDVVVDARLAKRNIDSSIGDAPLVVGLGPGFVAGTDCDAVVETKRGHRLGRVYWDGPAAADTGVPGIVEGRGAERVLRSPVAGAATWDIAIGDRVSEGQTLGRVAGVPVLAPFNGVARGLILEGLEVAANYKIGDIDPRLGVAWSEISDKALSIGGGVLEAVTTWQNSSGSTG